MLKNAVDYLYAEWNNEAMGVVSYGAVGGARVSEHLRLIAGELQMADVRTNVALSMLTDLVNFTDLQPGEHQVQALGTLMDQVIACSTAPGAAPRGAPGCVAPTEGDGDGELRIVYGDDEQGVRETFNDVELQSEDGWLVIFGDNDAILRVREEHVQSVEALEMT